jgi:hypothetical protein
VEEVCLFVFEKKSHVAMRGTLLTVVGSGRLTRRLGQTVGGLGLSVNGQLFFQVVEDLVRWGGQTASVG